MKDWSDYNQTFLTGNFFKVYFDLGFLPNETLYSKDSIPLNFPGFSDETLSSKNVIPYLWASQVEPANAGDIRDVVSIPGSG